MLFFVLASGSGFAYMEASTPERRHEKIVLYQFKICPTCNRIRSILDYLKVPYEYVEVNPFTRKEVKEISTIKKLPIVQFGREYVLDHSTAFNKIIDMARGFHDISGEELDSFSSPSARKWVRWAEERYGKLIFLSVTESLSNSKQALSYVQEVNHFSIFDKLLIQYLGPIAMTYAEGELQKKQKVKNIRQTLIDETNFILKELNDQQFFGGDKPNAGDIAIYGAINGIRGLDTFNILMNETKIGDWFKRIEKAIGSSSSTEKKL